MRGVVKIQHRKTDDGNDRNDKNDGNDGRWKVRRKCHNLKTHGGNDRNDRNDKNDKLDGLHSDKVEIRGDLAMSEVTEAELLHISSLLPDENRADFFAIPWGALHIPCPFQRHQSASPQRYHEWSVQQSAAGLFNL